MAAAAIASSALSTIVGRMISPHGHVTLHACHLMRTPLLVEGRGKSGYSTL